jgi:hypothetical protein
MDYLECGDLSPLSEAERIAAATYREKKAAINRRTPKRKSPPP